MRSESRLPQHLVDGNLRGQILDSKSGIWPWGHRAAKPSTSRAMVGRLSSRSRESVHWHWYIPESTRDGHGRSFPAAVRSSGMVTVLVPMNIKQVPTLRRRQ